MFTCTVCSFEYLDDSCSMYVCMTNFCETFVCLNCQGAGFLENYDELININWFEDKFYWLCSYKCMLDSASSGRFNINDISIDSMPYIHHKEAEKEIFNRHIHTKLVNEAYFLKELAQVVIEYLN